MLFDCVACCKVSEVAEATTLNAMYSLFASMSTDRPGFRHMLSAYTIHYCSRVAVSLQNSSLTHLSLLSPIPSFHLLILPPLTTRAVCHNRQCVTLLDTCDSLKVLLYCSVVGNGWLSVKINILLCCTFTIIVQFANTG